MSISPTASALRQRSLLLYRALLKKSLEFTARNEPSPDRSYRVSYLIPDEQYQQYLVQEIRKQFRQAQRLHKEHKKSLDWFQKQVEDGFIFYKGLGRAVDEAFNQQHNKRKAIRLSPFLHILKQASGSQGNYHYHQKLKEVFYLATIMTYRKPDETTTTKLSETKTKKD